MKNIQYNSFPELRFRDRVTRDIDLSSHIINMAEELSLYSATVIEGTELYFGALPNQAIEGLSWLIAVYLFLPAEKDYLRALCLNQICKKAHKYQYEGKWKIFQEILDLQKDEPFSYTDIWYEVLQNNFSQDDLFGNLSPLVRKYYRLFSKRKNLLHFVQVKKQNRVKFPQFQRGYKDKGSRILYNQRGSGTYLKGIYVSGPNPEKINYIERFPTTSPTSYMWLGPQGGGE